MYPRRIAEVKAAIAKDDARSTRGDPRIAWRRPRATVPAQYYEMLQQARVARSARLHHPGRRGRLPHRDEVRQHHDQLGPHRAPRHRAVHRSAARHYPAGSYVFKAAQAFRPHLLDMFEPQDHPNDFQYPGRSADSAVRQRRLDARATRWG